MLNKLIGLLFIATMSTPAQAAYDDWLSQPGNCVQASPNGSTGNVTCRALVAADIPALAYVATSTTVNGHPLSSNVTIAPGDLACTTNDFLIGVAGVATAQTPTQATALLNLFTTTLQGLAPSSGGGTTNFLRADGSWAAPPSSSGTVSTVSVVSANGLAGTVATATTTPAITLSTSVTGLLKGNGTAISAAVSGTDYQPAGNYITATTGDVTASGPGSVASTIAANAVTNAKAAQMAANTVKGNNTGVTANAADLTQTQLTAMVNPFSSTLPGACPASGGGTTNFLRADGSFAAPPGGGGGGSTPVVQIKSANYSALSSDTDLWATATLTFTIPDCSSLTAAWNVKNDSFGGVTTVTLSGTNTYDPVDGGGTTFQITDPGASVKITCASSGIVRVYQ